MGDADDFAGENDDVGEVGADEDHDVTLGDCPGVVGEGALGKYNDENGEDDIDDEYCYCNK